MPGFEIFLLLSSTDGARERERPSSGPLSATRGPSLSLYCRARFPPRGLMRRRQCAFLHALAYRNQWPRVTLRNGDLYRAFFSPHRVTRAYRDSSPLSFFFPPLPLLHLCFLFLPSPLSFFFSLLSFFSIFSLFLFHLFSERREALLRGRDFLARDEEETEREKSRRRVAYLLNGYRSESYLVSFVFSFRKEEEKIDRKWPEI